MTELQFATFVGFLLGFFVGYMVYWMNNGRK